MEDRELKANDGRDPDFTFKNPSSSKGGVFETFIRVSIEDDIIILFGKTCILLKICDNCEVDFCSGACSLFDYEDHQVTKQEEEYQYDHNPFQRKTQEELENEANEKLNKGLEKNRKTSKRKKSTKKQFIFQILN